MTITREREDAGDEHRLQDQFLAQKRQRLEQQMKTGSARAVPRVRLTDELNRCDS
ncbi:hypothetical protein D3C84_608230 [compost metagenome]